MKSSFKYQVVEISPRFCPSTDALIGTHEEAILSTDSLELAKKKAGFLNNAPYRDSICPDYEVREDGKRLSNPLPLRVIRDAEEVLF